MTTFTGTISVVAAGDSTTVSTKLATHSDALKALTEAWSTWIPTITAETGTFTTVSSANARYLQAGKLIIGAVQFTITTVGTAANGFRFTVPVTPFAGSSFMGSGRDSTSGAMLHITYIGGGVAQVNKYDNTSTIAAGHTLNLAFQYEAA